MTLSLPLSLVKSVISLGIKIASLVFTFDSKIKKNLISTITHLTRYIKVVLMRMDPHTFNQMEQNSTSISDSN